MIEADELLVVADGAVDSVVSELSEARHRDDLRVFTKSTHTDMVTEMDHWAERTLIEHIRSHRPADGFRGEEGTTGSGTSGVIWLIDPIDGTTNYLYDLPGASVSVAAAVDGEVHTGVVHDLIRDERFRALREGGATLDHVPIKVSGKQELATALVATGFSYRADRRRHQAELLVEVLPRVRDIRRFGGAAVDLCSVACARVDAYYERGLSEWDHAAGELIAREAGARTFVGDDGAVVASTPAIFEDLTDLLTNSGWRGPW